MGCGKSSVGKRLSELLCCRFADLDAAIEQQAGCSVSEIFERFGEPEFRRIEQQTLQSILETHGRVLGIPMTPAPASLQHPLAGGGMSSPSPSTTAGPSDNLVLALGGGAVMTEGSDLMVHEGSLCIYLRTSVDELVSRLSSETEGRPLLNTSTDPSNTALRTRILDLMSRRDSTYERVAHQIIDTDGKSIDHIAEEILNLL